MKRILIYFGLTMTLLYSVGCQEKAGQATYFSTPQEAASKAKNDLLAVLRSRKDIALGFEQQTIEKSQPAAPMLQYQITFEDLAAADSFNTLRRNALAALVPLIADGTVATVVGVAKSDAGWKVASWRTRVLRAKLMLFEKPSVHRLKSSYTICLTRAKRCMARCSPRLAERELSYIPTTRVSIYGSLCRPSACCRC